MSLRSYSGQILNFMVGRVGLGVLVRPEVLVWYESLVRFVVLVVPKVVAASEVLAGLLVILC